MFETGKDAFYEEADLSRSLSAIIAVRAVILLAGAMTLMFVLAPSTRFGYFIYPAALAIWLLAAVAGRRADDELGEIAVDFLPARVPDSPPPTA